MRVYLPLLPSELLLVTPPARAGFTVQAPPHTDREGVEVLEDDAQTEAALAALVALREAPSEYPVRVIVAQDVDAAQALPGVGVVSTRPCAVDWSRVAAIFADEVSAAPAVRAVLNAATQDTADAAVAALWEHCLNWFDVSERASLAARIGAATFAPSDQS